MNTPITPLEFNSIPNFWKDLKGLKSSHIKGLTPNFELDEEPDDYTRLKNYELLEGICNYIGNNYRNQIKNHVAFDRQPFIASAEIEIWKVDVAIDRKGTSGGLRIVYCLRKSNIYMVYMNKKSECSNEPKLQAEVFRRIKEYFGL